jgi:hypothetical protein
MKIQFEIDDGDVAILVDALDRAALQATTPRSFDSLQRVIALIREDVQNGVEALQLVKQNLALYTDGSPILSQSNFRTDLGISGAFIQSSHGLIRLLNQVLAILVAQHKPGVGPAWIKASAIATLFTVQELVNLILENYDASH